MPDAPRRPRPTETLLALADRYRWALPVLIVALYAAGFNNQWRIGPDSAMHMLVAEHLAAGQGYTHPTGHQLHINPGLAYLTAATFRLFGEHQFLAIHLVMLAMTAAVLALTYALVRLRFDRPTAVIVVAMVAVGETLYQHSFHVLTDVPFLAGAMVFLVGYELLRQQRSRMVAGVALLLAGTALMAAFRSIALIFLGAMALTVLVHLVRGPQRKRFAAIAAAAVVALLVMRAADPRTQGIADTLRDEGRALHMLVDQLPATLHRAVTDNGPQLLTEHLAEGALGVDFGPYVSVPLGLLVIAAGLSAARWRLLWGLLVGLCLLQWLLLVTTDRYVLAVLPLIAIGWWRLAVAAEQRWRGRRGTLVSIALVTFWFAPNLIQVTDFVREQRERPFLAAYEDGRYVALQALAAELRQRTGGDDLVIADDAQQLMYYSDRRVIESESIGAYGAKRRRTLRAIDAAERLWLVRPVGGRLAWKLERLNVAWGPAVVTIERPGDPPLTLHEGTPTGR